MKRLLVSILITMVVVGAANAEDVSKKTQWVGANPLGLVFNMYGWHYGRYLKNRSSDVTIPFFFWHPTDDYNIISIGAKYHTYKNGNGQGLFYGSGVQVMRVKWDYATLDNDGNKNIESITGITVTPQSEIGCRWIMGKNKDFTIAPSIAAGLTIGNIKSSNGLVKSEYGSAGASWQLCIGFAHMFSVVQKPKVVKPPIVGSKHPAPEGFTDAPAWVLSPSAIEGAAAVGIAKIGRAGIRFARTEALANARDELARAMNVRVSNMIKEFGQTTGIEDEQVEKVMSYVSRQIASEIIVGSRQKEMWVSPDKNVYVLVVIDTTLIKQTIKDGVELSYKDNTVLRQQWQDKSSYEKLGKKIDEEFDKDK